MDAFSAMLINEAEIVGTPTIPKEQIELLSIITLTKEHVDKCTECEICMEEFYIRDKVKKLPCENFYHEKCITSWLERHATNCRKVVKPQTKNGRSRSCCIFDVNSRSGVDRRRFSEPCISDSFSSGPFHFL